MKALVITSVTMSYRKLLEFRLHSRHKLAPKQERKG